ncbi:MAG: bifunctional adenosylcobinamide kinase/adenosylcobinamide-phosphate guanylyltransferase [Kiloniellaceae bacterium]
MSALPPVTLVLGGARSGKSRYAEALVESRPGACVYLATAEPGDEEMAARIAAHRARRGARWTTVEEPLDVVGALRKSVGAERAVLVDCLTLWLSNLLGAGRDPEEERARLLAALPGLAGPVVFISNEVGLGVVPDNPLARRFVDCAGQLNQALAAAAQSVVAMTAGLPLRLKGPGYAEAPDIWVRAS